MESDEPDQLGDQQPVGVQTQPQYGKHTKRNGTVSSTLLYQAGPRVREIFRQLPETGDESEYDTAKAKLKNYFEPQKNRRYEVYRFRKAVQEPKETLDNFHTRLRTLASPNMRVH